MILSAYASPMPGNAISCAFDAAFRSISAFAFVTGAALFAALFAALAGAGAFAVDLAFVCAPRGRARERSVMRMNEKMRFAFIGPPERDGRKNLERSQPRPSSRL